MTTVEPATTEDLDALLDLWVALVEDQRRHGTHLLGEANRPVARDVLGRYVAAGDLLVAREGGSVLGFVMVHVETGLYRQDVTRGVIDNVYVRPAERDRGVGAALMDAAERHLAADGASRVSLSVLADNDAARRLYERRGYEPHRYTLEKPVGNTTDTSDAREE